MCRLYSSLWQGFVPATHGVNPNSCCISLSCLFQVTMILVAEPDIFRLMCGWWIDIWSWMSHAHTCRYMYSISRLGAQAGTGWDSHMFVITVFSPGPFGREAPPAFIVSLTLMWEGNQLMWSQTTPTRSALIFAWGEPWRRRQTSHLGQNACPQYFHCVQMLCIVIISLLGTWTRDSLVL